MNPEDMVDAIKASLARVLPGALVLFLGTMLMLGAGVLLLTEGPPLVRSLTAGLPQPFRSLVLFAALAGPLLFLCWLGRRVMGYTISQITRPKGDA